MKNLKWALQLIGQIKGLYLLSIAVMLLETISLLATVGFQKVLIDDVFVDGNYERFWSILLWMIAAYVSYSLLVACSPSASLKNVTRLRMIVTNQFMKYIYKIPVAKLNKERTGHYVYYTTDDLLGATDLVGDNIPRLIQQIFQIIVLITIIGMANPLLLVAVIGCGVLYILLIKFFYARMKKISNGVKSKKSDLIVHIEEGISSTREVIAYNRLQWEMKIYNKLFKQYFDAVINEGKLQNRQLIITDPLKWGVGVLVLLIGGYLVLKNALSIGTFIVVYQFSLQLMAGFHNLYFMCMVKNLIKNITSLERLRVVMEGEIWTEGTHVLDENIQELRLEHVTFRYNDGAEPVLNGINLNIPVGKKIAFVGTSGGGKSTIAQLLVRFYDPEDGRIVVNGNHLFDITRASWMNRLAIVFQEPYIFPDTIRNNLLLGLEGRSESDIVHACQSACIHDFFAGLPDGYETVLGERGFTLSGGQRQRLALARAILRDSEILILDEATSSLDLETERQVQRNLDMLRENKTTIIIAHRLSTIQNADLIYVLDQGRIAEQGTHNELLQKGDIYKQLVYAQNEQVDRVYS
ncbi:Lipid A export ATP-binding/permease protein MsbA [compost metagenome]